jgi:hypothetical protein
VYGSQHKPSNLAIWGACVLSVPLVQIALLTWEYRLQLPMVSWVAVVILAIVAISSLAFLMTQFSSRAHRAVVAVAFVPWMVLAYLAVSFYVGCRWAPACV